MIRKNFFSLVLIAIICVAVISNAMAASCDFTRHSPSPNWRDSSKGGSGVGGSQASINGNKIQLSATSFAFGTFWAQGQLGDQFKMTGKTQDYRIFASCCDKGYLGAIAGPGKETFKTYLIVFDATNNAEIARKLMDSAEVKDIGGPISVNNCPKTATLTVKLYKNNQYRVIISSKIETVGYGSPGSAFTICDFYTKSGGIVWNYIDVKC